MSECISDNVSAGGDYLKKVILYFAVRQLFCLEPFCSACGGTLLDGFEFCRDDLSVCRDAPT